MTTPAQLRRGFWVTIGAMLLLALALALPAAAADGNNGTVKIHEGDTETEPIVHNQPHVCTFHLHFFFADPEQSGAWWIKAWPPTGDRSTVLDGTYDTAGDGEDRQPATGVYELAPGHYKLFWMGDEEHLLKHKVFWVECAPVATATPTPSPTPTASATSTATPAETPAETPPNGTGTTHGPQPPDTALPGPSGAAGIFGLLVIVGLGGLLLATLRSRRLRS